MSNGKPGIAGNPLDQGQGDLHTQVALFMLACHRSEHGDHPHAIDLVWMAGVINRLVSQRDQTVALNTTLLAESVRHELARRHEPGERIEQVVSWVDERIDRLNSLRD